MFFLRFCSFQRLFRVFGFPQVVQKHTLGEVELEWLFDGKLCHEYLSQKLLEFDNPSSSYSR